MPVVLRLSAGVALALAALALPSAASAASGRSAHVLPGAWQARFHVRSAAADPDGDGLSNWTEFRAHTNPRRADTNHDGVDDGAEDYDRDGLANATEQAVGTDPALRDTNGNGRPDGREDADHDGLPNLVEQETGYDPTQADTDGDGVDDGDSNAGRVTAWDPGTGELSIRLAGSGRTLTGVVDDTTDVSCDSPGGYLAVTADDGSGDGSSDPSTDGSDSTDTATAADVTDPSSDPGTDPSTDGTDPADGSDGGVTFDQTCFDDVLAPGAWVHDADVNTDGGDVTFDGVELIDPSIQD